MGCSLASLWEVWIRRQRRFLACLSLQEHGWLIAKSCQIITRRRRECRYSRPLAGNDVGSLPTVNLFNGVADNAQFLVNNCLAPIPIKALVSPAAHRNFFTFLDMSAVLFRAGRYVSSFLPASWVASKRFSTLKVMMLMGAENACGERVTVRANSQIKRNLLTVDFIQWIPIRLSL